MPGLFQSLEIGKRALLSHQVNLQTIGHNIANVNTPGYSRQRVRINNSMPEINANGIYGTGIQVDDIRHVRDLFLGQQFQAANKQLGEWGYKRKTLSQVESIINEPTDTALNHLLDTFWDSWSELAVNSDSSNNRKLVITQATQLVNGLKQRAQQLTQLRDATDRDLAAMTEQVNGLTAEIAQLNKQIAASELGGDNANDLRDRRDLLTDELALLVDVNTTEKENGASIVRMGGMVLVDAASSFEIGVNVVNKSGASTHELVWKGTEVNLRNISGQLAGLTESRDEIIPRQLAQLDELAKAIVEQVNAIHSTGYTLNGSTGINFFDPTFTTASTIRINQAILNDSNYVIASETPDGDNLAALALAELRVKPVLADGSQSINEFYNAFVGGLGVEAREAISFEENYQLLRHQVENARQSVQGVSLDEEMAQMVKFQHAYDAAARVITTMDEALSTVINGMGIVGR